MRKKTAKKQLSIHEQKLLEFYQERHQENNNFILFISTLNHKSVWNRRTLIVKMNEIIKQPYRVVLCDKDVKEAIKYWDTERSDKKFTKRLLKLFESTNEVW